MTWRWWVIVLVLAVMIALSVTWRDFCAGASPGSWLSEVCPVRTR